ncbi:MAG: hypothetical protein JF616_15245 [Fibrobacteres bacterium]|nr:hypothetical protein [Fibrobacterota bacterium]
MIFTRTNAFSLAAMAAAAALFAACDSSPTSPQAGTSAEARADLQAMAAKVKYFAPQQPGSGQANGAGKAGVAKRGAGKTGANKTLVDGCDLDATEYETWNTDTTIAGGVTVQYDTTVSYTSADQLICSFDDVTAYQLAATRSQNAMLETHIHTRTDLPADFLAGEFKMTGSGTVNYTDGYLITITSVNIVIDLGQGIMKTYVMNLALEKGYTVVLQVAPGANLMSDSKPGANDVEVSGPISKDGAVVGYFEVMGDDRVVIRDADKAVIESHG